jgi:hypothetical protein
VSLESVEQKAQRYLTSGRLNVRLATPQRIEAFCRGDSGHCYRLGHENDVWWCSCPARQLCAHLVALKRVVTRPGTEVLGCPGV